MGNKNQINVNINIKGDVSNSEINGIKIESNELGKRDFTLKSLFYRVFIDYLRLPSLEELQSRFDVDFAIKRGRVSEFRRIRNLWEGLPSGNIFPEAAVILHDIQLVNFVNREPNFRGGYYYDSYRYSDRYSEDFFENNLITPSIITWQSVYHYRSGTVAFLGLGDVHLASLPSGDYLLSVVSKGGEKIANIVKNEKSSDDLMLNEEFQQTRAYRFSNTKQLNKLELARQLHDFVQFVFLDRELTDIDSMPVGGFPIIVSKEVYGDIAEMLYQYGAVALDKISCVVTKLPDTLPIEYGLSHQKWCLYVGSRSHLEGIKSPSPTVCSAWTMADVNTQENEDATDKYLQWMFVVGEKNWRSNLSHAVDVIKTVGEKVGAKVLFEFDEETNWFGTHTPFKPKNMREIYKQLENGNYNITLDSDE